MDRVKILPRTGKRRELAQLIRMYKQQHPEEDDAAIVPERISHWAFQHGHWKRPPLSPEEILRKDISRYLKDEHMEDPQGRRIRKYQTVYTVATTARGQVRQSVSYPTLQAPPQHMKMALQLRRRSAFNDVRQLDLDLQSYNDNNIFGTQLPSMDYNMTHDVAESQESTSYPDAPFDGNDEDDEGA